MISSLMLPSATTLRPCCSCSITPSSSSRRIALFHLLTTGGIGNLSLLFSTSFSKLSFIYLFIYIVMTLTWLVLFCCCCIWLLALPQSQLLGGKGSELFKLAEANAAVNLAQPDQNLVNWVQNDNRRFLHVVYKVGDLDKTIKFYTECLGMKLLRKRDIPEDKYSNAFLGYGPEDSSFTVELTYNYGVDNYDIGTGFGHFGIIAEDVSKTVDIVKAKGGKVTREPGSVKGSSIVTASVEDPSGYRFELLEKRPTREPLCKVMLRVGDLDRVIAFYEKAVGMKLLHKIDNPEEKYTVAKLGYGPEANGPVLELTYNYGVTNYDKGNGYAQIAIGTDDVYKTAEAIKSCGAKIIREPGPLPGINTKIVVCLDPDGWKLVFVDNVDFLKELE